MLEPHSTEMNGTFGPNLLGIGDAARLLGVSRTTVQKMVDAGDLQAVRTSGGHRRILKSSLEQHLHQRLPGRLGSDEKRLHVLIPEDNPLMRQTYEQRITRWGIPIELSLCTDAVDALLLIERKRPHVIITDLRMDPFDGFHLLRVLRSQPMFASQSIVVVSSMTPDEIQAKGGLPPSVCLYGKPPPWDRLRGFLEACAQRELGLTTLSGSTPGDIAESGTHASMNKEPPALSHYDKELDKLGKSSPPGAEAASEILRF